MDFRISKTKLLKKTHEPRTRWSKNISGRSSISKKDLNDLETLPVINNVKTPQRNTDRRVDFANDSPQFRVGWSDGFDSSILPGAESPVIPAVQQRIRRCPDELCKNTKKTIHPKNLEIERDRQLGCVTWAKNLLEISLEPQNETPTKRAQLPTERNRVDNSEGSVSVEHPEESVRDSRIDIADDTVDELMVLCSQAVEEEVIGKRPRTSVDSQPKKQKLESSKNKSRSNAKSATTVESKVSKVLHFDQKNVIESNTEIVKKSDKLVDSMDLFKCVLDDDDEFSSFDFNYLDNLQNTHSQNCSVPKPSFNECNPKPRYTKEQIEQRRLEAKKKLLFKKKHKSM